MASKVRPRRMRHVQARVHKARARGSDRTATARRARGARTHILEVFHTRFASSSKKGSEPSALATSSEAAKRSKDGCSEVNIASLRASVVSMRRGLPITLGSGGENVVMAPFARVVTLVEP